MPFLAQFASDITPLVLRFAETGPDPKDVKAGWTAFVIFLLLIAAVVFLGFSLVKQLRKAQAAQDAGVYGDSADDSGDDSAERPDPRGQQPG